MTALALIMNEEHMCEPRLLTDYQSHTDTVIYWLYLVADFTKESAAGLFHVEFKAGAGGRFTM